MASRSHRGNGFSVDGDGDPIDGDGDGTGDGTGDGIEFAGFVSGDGNGIGSGGNGTGDGTEENEVSHIRKRRTKQSPEQSPLNTIFAIAGGTPTGERQKAGRKPRKMDEAGAKIVASLFVTLFQGVAVQLAGEHAAFTAQERSFIEPSLARLLARLPMRTAAVIQQWMDPAMMVFGLGMWLTRLYKVEREKREAAAMLAYTEAQHRQEHTNDNPGGFPVPPVSTQQRNGVKPADGDMLRGNIVAPVPDDIIAIHMGGNDGF